MSLGSPDTTTVDYTYQSVAIRPPCLSAQATKQTSARYQSANPSCVLLVSTEATPPAFVHRREAAGLSVVEGIEY